MKIFSRLFLFITLSLTIVAGHASPLSQFNFIALADIHFDPFTVCSKKNDCPLINELRDENPGQWPKILGQYDRSMPKYGEDTTWPLLHSALSASAQTAEKKHASFVLILGDFMGHDFYSSYRRFSGERSNGYSAFSGKYFKFLTQQIAAAFPDTDVYMVVGNNDSYSGDYSMKPNGQFFSEVSALWSSLIKDPLNRSAMAKQFSYAGYYSIVLSELEELQLIVMNSNLFSLKVKGKNAPLAASRQLDWLHKELQSAKNAGRRVFIAMHMPEGVDLYALPKIRLFRLHALWKPEYIQRFDSEINQFSAQVAGIFSGHVHRNWYQVITVRGNEIPMIGVLAISPISDSDPGFRDISYSTNPLRFDDMLTYSYSLNGGKNWVSN